jgi:gamma-glutamylcyclotransferase
MTDEATAKLLYFAYGSNMLSRRLLVRVPSPIAMGVGYTSGRRLTFDKVSTDGSGKCDIEPTQSPTDRVYGVLFEIASAEKAKLDDAEGLGKGYREERVDVVTSCGTRQALAHVATAKEPALRPYHWYKALVVAGATEHRLPNPYVEWLRTVEAKQDPKVNRRAENEALLFGG